MARAKEERQFFHESWYRIAGERLALRASVRVRRQLFRGSRWYVLHEPFSDKFFRFRPPAYEFVSRLDGRRTVDEVWRERLERDPENAPGQEEVIQLLSQLFHANLLHYDLPADSEKLFERYKERRQSTRRATLRSIMFFRIPLIDPNAPLKELLPFIRAIWSPFGAAVWIGTIIAAIVVTINHFSQLEVQSQGLLALSNIPLLYLSVILIKTLHEFGHASTVVRFGGNVHTMGIMFLIFNPLPYTDSTAAWSFRSKWQRVLVGAAGMITELFVAAIAAFVWANTGAGTLHALAYNMMIVASVSTVVFNANPLMRFDGYYILSDLLDIPNLNSRSAQHLRHLVERYAFGYKASRSPASSRSEALWLTLFGLASGVYRVLVFSTILFIVANRFLLLGILMAAVSAVAWVITPLLRLVGYLASSPRLERTRLRAAAVSLCAVAFLVGLLAVVRFPDAFKAPGVLQAREQQLVANQVAGYVESVSIPTDTRVKKGEVLLRLRNPDLDYEIEQIRARLRQGLILRQKAVTGSGVDLAAIDSTIASIRKELAHLEAQQGELAVTAQIPGIWVAPQARELAGAWLRRGTAIGQVIDDTRFYFASVVSEQNASSVFSGAIVRTAVRLADDPSCDLPVTSMTRIPVQQKTLPSAALGFQGGGSIATSATSPSGAIASQPFYELRLHVRGCGSVPLYQGVSGEVRFELKSQPLLVQGLHKLRQLVQERYHI